MTTRNYGKNFIQAKNARKTCPHCGHINEELDMKTRQWKCSKCVKILGMNVKAVIDILDCLN